MKKNPLKKKKWYQSGFTLLFATLIASLLLSLGISILDITLQNFILSSTGRESQFAFYAADSGLECSEYWDRQYVDSSGAVGSAFTPATNDTSSAVVPATQITCAGKTAALTSVPSPTNTATDATTTTTFQIDLTDLSPSALTNECFAVAVIKSAHVVMADDGSGTQVVDPTNSRYHTTIQSRGYNTCDETNLRRLERGIKIDY